jgi:hypothetical protein
MQSRGDFNDDRKQPYAEEKLYKVCHGRAGHSL